MFFTSGFFGGAVNGLYSKPDIRSMMYIQFAILAVLAAIRWWAEAGVPVQNSN